MLTFPQLKMAQQQAVSLHVSSQGQRPWKATRPFLKLGGGRVSAKGRATTAVLAIKLLPCAAEEVRERNTEAARRCGVNGERVSVDLRFTTYDLRGKK